jgi:drug/metabolite transporter (DMT)-like permease
VKGAEFGVHLRLLGMALLWGASWPAGRVLAQAMPPLAGSAWRFSLAVVLLLAWLRWHLGAWPRLSRRQWLGLFAAGTVGVFGYSAFFMLALKNVEASRAAVVVTTNPVFTTLLAAWWFKERFNARIGLGLALAVIGAATVLTHGAPWKVLAGDIGIGEWLLLGCVATWSSYALMGKRLMVGIDSLTATAVTATIGCLLLWAAAFVFEGPAAVRGAVIGLSGQAWFALVFLAVGATVLAYAWFYRGIEVLGAGVASSYISLVPVFGVASSVLLLGERLDASLLVGGALAIAGVVVANRARQGPATGDA